MRFGIIHHGSAAYHRLATRHYTCKIAAELPGSQTLSLWNKALTEMGYEAGSTEPTPKDLFNFVKSVFEQYKGELLDITFMRAYVASADGESPISANKESRLHSEENAVYIDELILAALFEYVATYYLWAIDYENTNTFSFCFRYTLMLLNHSCRLGFLTTDSQKVQLVEQIISHCDSKAVDLIADLYWSCLAFAFCHEIAHIYLKHTDEEIGCSSQKREFDADAVGYEVYLHIIETTCKKSSDPFSKIFHDYLYTAPMILFQFYEDAYYLNYWLFGELAGDSHPPLRERIDALFQISEQPQYTFDTKEGNILLNNYMDVSDWFREQLIIKLQKGKLNQLIQKGVGPMSKNGYLKAIQFQENMCDDLCEVASKHGLDIDRLIGLWDTAVDINLLDAPGTNSFVWSHKGKTYSSKAFNVRFSLKKILESVLEFGGSFHLPDDPVKTVFVALLILYKLVDMGTQQLSESHAAALIKCYQLRADIKPIQEEILLRIPGVSNATVTELSQLGCIKIFDGLVQLSEAIFIH